MRNKMFWRWGELGAVFSLLIWLILTPFMATIWVYDGGRLVWEQKPLLVRTIGQWLADQGAFTFAAEEVVYHSYGRYFFLVYLLLIPTVMAVHHRYATENKRHHCWYKILLRFARRCHKRLCFVWSGDFFLILVANGVWPGNAGSIGGHCCFCVLRMGLSPASQYAPLVGLVAYR